MKKVKYLAMLLAAGMFAACSDNLEDTGAGNAGGTTPATGEGYVKVVINMPTTSGGMSRADDGSYVDLNDGKESEYKVNTGIIAFFKANKNADADATATFIKAYDLGNLSQNNDLNDDHITTKVSMVTEAPIVDDTENLYALVILNPNNIFSVGTGETNAGNLMMGEKPVLQKNDKLSNLQNKEIGKTTSKNCTTNGFLMLNAPLTETQSTSVSGVDVDATTLALVHVYAEKSAAEAESAIADEIYVERVVAKVTMSGWGENGEISVGGTGSYQGDKVTLSGWTLNVVNNYTYWVRDVSGLKTWTDFTSNPGRFVGTLSVSSTKSLYRVYWAIDPNYDNDQTGNDNFTIYGSSTSDNDIEWETNSETTIGGDEYPLYCLENTFDVNHQIENQTTTVLIKAIYDMNPNNESAESFFMVENIAATYTEKEFLDYIKSKVTALSSANLSINPNIETGGYYNKVGGTKKLSELILSDNAEISDESIKTALDGLGEISYYKDGATYYYAARIQHFDSENETTWTPGETYTEDKHLGRYGVVRNNWYEISVTSISGPGTPEIEDPTPDPDDESEGFIKCTINVLSWAKRTQEVEL